jgi:hypothetical protein
MEAIDLIEHVATSLELALVAAYSLDLREVGLSERGDHGVDAHRVVTRERFILAQPAKLVEDHMAILVGALVAIDLGEFHLGMAGERRHEVLGLKFVVAGERLFGSCGGHRVPVRGAPGGTICAAGIGVAAGIGDAIGTGVAGGI